MYKNIIKNCNVFFDGNHFAGKSEELTLPKLTIKTEEFRAGGMDVPAEIDMGMEKLEASFDISGVEAGILKKLGIATGEKTPLTFRAAQQDADGSIKPVVVEMHGFIKEADMGTWKPGSRAKTKYKMIVDSYKLTYAGKPVIEIDVMNCKRIINGVDHLAGVRSAIGM